MMLPYFVDRPLKLLVNKFKISEKFKYGLFITGLILIIVLEICSVVQVQVITTSDGTTACYNLLQLGKQVKCEEEHNAAVLYN